MLSRRELRAAFLTLLFLSLTATSASAEEFYKGKILTFIVGTSPGGGFDTYTRAIARHIGKHIPGNPTILVENMPGAGGLVAANHMYNRVKSDGLTVGLWAGSFVLGQRLEQKGIQFDAARFEWMGVPVKDSPVCVLTKASGISNLNEWVAAKKPVKLGGTGPGSTPSIPPRVLKEALGLPIQLIDGYKGTSNIRLAAESGEIDGGCWNWESIKPTWRQGLELGNVKVVVQVNPERHPDLPNVPNAIEFAKSGRAQRLIEVGVHDQAGIFRAYSIAPGTPPERVESLQTAFMATMKDPEFLAEAKKSKLDLNPSSGQRVKEIVARILKTDEGLIRDLKRVLFD